MIDLALRRTHISIRSNSDETVRIPITEELWTTFSKMPVLGGGNDKITAVIGGGNGVLGPVQYDLKLSVNGKRATVPISLQLRDQLSKYLEEEC